MVPTLAENSQFFSVLVLLYNTLVLVCVALPVSATELFVAFQLDGALVCPQHVVKAVMKVLASPF